MNRAVRAASIIACCLLGSNGMLVLIRQLSSHNMAIQEFERKKKDPAKGKIEIERHQKKNAITLEVHHTTPVLCRI